MLSIDQPGPGRNDEHDDSQGRDGARRAAVGRAPAFAESTAVEYYHAGWGHYFVTAFPAEIAALDGGAHGGAWRRTGGAA